MHLPIMDHRLPPRYKPLLISVTHVLASSEEELLQVGRYSSLPKQSFSGKSRRKSTAQAIEGLQKGRNTNERTWSEGVLSKNARHGLLVLPTYPPRLSQILWLSFHFHRLHPTCQALSLACCRGQTGHPWRLLPSSNSLSTVRGRR